MVDENKRKEIVYSENSKSMGVAYLLWACFGLVGAHRFYLGQTKSGIASLLLWLIPFIGWTILALWWLIDAFRIPGAVNEHDMKIINMLNHADPEGGPEPQVPQGAVPPKALTEADRKREAMLEDLRSTGYRKEPRDTSYLYR